jgi:transposase
MKLHKISPAFALVAILSISTMFANTLPVEDIIIGNTMQSISVNWDNLTQQTIHVKILNASQEVVMQESVKNQTEFMKQYQVSGLSNGHYNLVITKKSSRITQPFSIQNGKLSLSETDRKVTYLPIFSQKNNQFDVSVFLGYSGIVSVNVLDESKNKIFTHTYTDVSILHKRFSLDSVAEGMYKVEVIAGDETFYYSIVK